MIEKIKDFTGEILNDAMIWRRDFHKFPEVGFTEFRTASLIARRLKNMGCEIKAGREIMDDSSRMSLPSPEVLADEFARAQGQGGDIEFMELMKGGFPAVSAIISNGKGPVVALRVDIDALPIKETVNETHFPFKNNFISVNDGVMHACGHDANAASGLAIAYVLMKMKEYINGTVKIIFQPAEEIVSGAAPIVKSGFLDDVERIISLHYYSLWDSGTVTCIRGTGYLASTKLDVKFTGKPTHSGMTPEAGKSALLAAASAILNMNAIPRNSKGATRINVGKLVAGTSRNITCAEALMKLETRGATSELDAYMQEHVKRILKASAMQWDCELEIIPVGSVPNGGSDDFFADEIMAYAEKNLILKPFNGQRSCGSEDFTCMLDHVRKNGGAGAAITVGAGPGAKHHTSDFDIDESAIESAVRFFSGFLLELTKKK